MDGRRRRPPPSGRPSGLACLLRCWGGHTLYTRQPRKNFPFLRAFSAAPPPSIFASASRSISVVGAPLRPCGVVYILQPSAYSAGSGTGNRSSPFTLIVGLPANRSSWASSSVLTAIRSTSASRPSSSRTSRKVFSALRYVGHPSKYRISICIALRLLDASWRTYTIAPYGPTPVAVPIHQSAWKGYSPKFAGAAFERSCSTKGVLTLVKLGHQRAA